MSPMSPGLFRTTGVLTPMNTPRLTDAQAAHALAQACAGKLATEIARELGVPYHAITPLLRGETYRHVPGERPPKARRYPPKGEGHHHHGRRKLDAAAEAEVLRLHAGGATQAELERRFGLSELTVRRIVEGR